MKTQVLIAALLFAIVAHAEEDTDKTEPDDFFTMSFSELANVEITGSTLSPENLKTVPSAVTVFSHNEIKQLPFDTLDELMNLVPGFQSYRSSASSLDYPYSSRGRSIGTNGAEILLLVDGQRLNDPRTGGGVKLIQKFPLMYIERVEFIRGPGAAIYGSNAMMGVINIITRSDVNELAAGYGSFNRRQAYLLASQQIGDVGINLFGHIDKDDGEDYHAQDGFNPGRVDTDDPRDLADFNAKIDWRKTHIHLQHYQSRSENFYITNHLSNDFNRRDAEFNSISLRQDFDWESIASSIWLSYSRSDVRSHGQLTAPGALTAVSDPPSNDALFASPDFDDYEEVRVQWHNDWDIDARSNLQLGIEMRHIEAPEAIAENNFDISDIANGIVPVRYYGGLHATTPVQAESSRNIVGLYGQYQRQLLESTRLTLGLRYDDFSNIGDQLSPRVALVQELNDHHTVKLLFGQAFRAPSESELNLINNPVFLGNRDLKPETVQSWDLIWVGQWPRTTVSLGYFENHFKDSIIQTGTGGGSLQYNNTNQGPTRGVEVELYRELNERLRVRAAYTYIFDKPDESFREADQTASAIINYRLGKWNANVTAIYHSERKSPVGGSTSTRITLDDYWQHSGKLSYNFNPDWETFIQVKNLLHEDYATPAEGTNLTDGVPNRGREILVGMILRF